MAVQQNTQTPTVSTTEVTQHDTRFALTERRLHESGHSMAGPEKHSVRTDGNGLHFVWVRDLFRVSEEDVREPKIHRKNTQQETQQPHTYRGLWGAHKPKKNCFADLSVSTA